MQLQRRFVLIYLISDGVFGGRYIENAELGPIQHFEAINPYIKDPYAITVFGRHTDISRPVIIASLSANVCTGEIEHVDITAQVAVESELEKSSDLRRGVYHELLSIRKHWADNPFNRR